ncbi:MAG: 3-oxoacyl-[acyl-carrier-protein] synthase 3 [Alphaproteobacteria bacterium MarineAlpha11_Bin1]|nr:MAG: 3-oxoacyl-[acyl-carrier-protein] synthase 3 [Alphaproteobacteria bacterium MarineAlpha11_Bin1]|tara:strand:- start:28797 stop:29771 length:975 start_codon:yes stop_codon:yes gene_type:complete
MVRRSVIAGCGGYLPNRVVTNEELADRIDTSNEWIVQRTGIKSRHIAEEDQNTSDLALAAAKQALNHASIEASEVDLIVLATATPNNTFPSTATMVQAALGMTRGSAFDVQAVCSGFVFAMNVADNFIRLGQAETVLVVGAETFSRILDWKDRTTCVLFGDGAGAVVLRAEEGTGESSDRGILANCIHSDGRHYGLLYVDGGASTTQTVGHLRMDGPEVFKHAVKNLSSVIGEVLELAGLQSKDVDWLVPHQANQRIITSTARKLRVDEKKIVMTVDRHANTSAASIPLALNTAVQDGRITAGDVVVLEAMGGGFTWGASVIRW